MFAIAPRFMKIWASSLGLLLLLWTLPVSAQPPTPSLSQSWSTGTLLDSAKQPVDASKLLPKFATANVIYLGETHDSATDHAAQLQWLQQLYQQNPNLAIAMEMFQQPYQSILDRYLAGELSDAELVDRSQYDQRWGFPWEYYRPILQFARQHHLPVIALNVPTEITHKVSRQGLDSLRWSDRRWIPARSAIHLEPDSYRDRLRQIYDEMHQGKGNSRGFEAFFQAQVLWDETMADRLSRFVKTNPKTLVVTIVGQGHLLYGEGIPQRVDRRLKPQRIPFQQFNLLLNPDADLLADPKPAADFYWRSSSAE